jgi:hypothetical protein
MATTKPKTTSKDEGPTRAKAEKALSAGADPVSYLKHKNKHVRVKAQKKLDAAKAPTDLGPDAA